MSARPGKAADSVDFIVDELVREGLMSLEVSRFRTFLRDLDRVVPTDSPKFLADAIAELDSITEAVPWAMADWTSFCPSFSDLPEVGRLVSHSATLTIPNKHMADFLVLATLRRHTNHKHYDFSARALLISLALRVDTSEAINPLDRSKAQSRHESITVLGSRIKGLNRNDNRRARVGWFSPPHEQAKSAQGYLLALIESCRAANPRDEELCNALSGDGKRLFGLLRPALSDPLPPVGPVQPPISLPDDFELETEEEEFQGPAPPKVQTLVVSVPDSDEVSAEALDESSVAVSYVARSTPTRSPASFGDLRAMMRREARSQNIAPAGELFLDPHIEALTSIESETLAAALKAKAQEFISKGRHELALDLALVSILMCTGQTPARLLALLQPKSETASPQLLEGKLILKSMLPESAFTLNGHTELVPVDDEWVVELPPSVSNLLRTVDARGAWPDSEDKLISRLQEGLKPMREASGIKNLTIGRIRKAYAVLIHSVSRDFCCTAMLAQDRFRQSPAPLHYYSASPRALNQIYRSAIWTLFRDRFVLPQSPPGHRIGSRALPRKEAVTAAAKIAKKPIHAPVKGGVDAELTRAHNAMVSHIVMMLLAVCGHRPSTAIFRLTRWDLDTEMGAAIFADKISDAAHLRRLAGLGTRVSSQLDLYLLHLEEIVERSINGALKSRAKGALRGDVSLFFRIDEECEPKDASLDWLWAQTAGRPDIPNNWGRHYLGGVGREQTNRPYLIGIQLGHFESVGYPFCPDSPLCPRDFIEAINPILDDIFKDQGWTIQKGLARGRPEARAVRPTKKLDEWDYTGPLVNWSARNREFAAEAKKRNLAIRRARWAKQHEKRQIAEQAVLEIAAETDLSLARLLAYFINERRQKRFDDKSTLRGLPNGEDPPVAPPSAPIAGIDRAVDSLFESIPEKLTDPDTAMAAHNIAARSLNSAHRMGHYQGPIYWPWLALRPLDLSPFTSGLFRAYRQIRALHSHFEGLKVRKGPMETGADPAAVVAMALAIYGGIDDEQLLEELTFGECSVHAVPSIPDSIVVHSHRLKHSCGLRGVVALAYLTWHRSKRDRPEEAEDLDELLRGALPERAFTGRTRLTSALCSTVAMVNRVQRSGMANLALDLENGCTCLDPEQLNVLLSGSEHPDSSRPSASGVIEVTYQAPSEGGHGAVLSKEYRYLRGLFSKDKNSELLFSQQIWRYDYKERDSERDKLVLETRLIAEDSSWTWFGRLWASWLAYELKRPKLVGDKGDLAYSYVFGSFGETATKMRALLARGPESRLQESPSTPLLEGIYREILEGSPETSQERICKTLMSFHKHLVEKIGIDDVDPSDYWEYWRPNRRERAKVRAWIPTKNDLTFIDSELLRHCDPDSTLSQLENIDRRTIRQAYLAFRLAADSGCRIGEIMGLLCRDIQTLAPKCVTVLVRRNRLRRLKTRAARRLVDLSPCQSPQARHLLIRHLDAEIERRPPRLRPQVWMFSDSEDRPISISVIRPIVDQAAIPKIGRPLPWHSLRHRYICDQILRLLIGIGLEQLSDPVVATPSYLLLTPQDAACETATNGHSRSRTSLISYFHLPWIFQLREFNSSADSKQAVAVATNVTKSHAYEMLRKAKSISGLVALSASKELNKDFQLPDPTQAETSPDIKATPNTPRLCKALHALGNGAAIGQVEMHPGLTKEEIAALRRADETLAATTSIGIFRDNPYSTERYSRPPKWTPEADSLKALWVQVELQSVPLSLRLVEVWQMHAGRGLNHGLSTRRSPRTILIWPANELATIEEVVGKTQLKLDVVQTNNRFCAIRITDSKGKNVSGQLVWVLSIAWIVASARKALDKGEKN